MVIPLCQEDMIDQEIGKYLNRLSDFLFVAARHAACFEKKPETIWKKSAV
jgi:cob(I)alamin adenosyltransferase